MGWRGGGVSAKDMEDREGVGLASTVEVELEVIAWLCACGCVRVGVAVAAVVVAAAAGELRGTIGAPPATPAAPAPAPAPAQDGPGPPDMDTAYTGHWDSTHAVSGLFSNRRLTKPRTPRWLSRHWEKKALSFEIDRRSTLPKMANE